MLVSRSGPWHRIGGAAMGAAAMMAFGCVGSGGGPNGPYQPVTETDRNQVEALRLSREAATKLDSDPEGAEKLLRAALTADLYCGPAHNNLGALYLRWSPPRLYEAANELEWACKLMPGHPDPRMNLAMTLEAAGRSNDAIASYRSALEVQPGYIPAVQAMTSLQLRSDKSDDSTGDHLREIALRGTTAQWREWAKVQMFARAK